MAVRPPRLSRPASVETGHDVLGHEIMAEKASALGRAGREVERRISQLDAMGNASPEREQALKDAAYAVWAYFLQRELCGMRRHDAVIREYAIPREVLARLGTW